MVEVQGSAEADRCWKRGEEQKRIDGGKYKENPSGQTG